MASASTEALVAAPRQQQRSDTEYSIATLPPPKDEDQESSRSSNALSYMHRPPTIMPNYGKKSRGSVLPKSNVSRVLLYDNITQQTMLDVRLNSIQSQSHKTNRELEMHMKSFIFRRKSRQKALKNLTRVQHHEDYLDFQKDQQQVRHRRHRFGSFESESSDERASPANQFLPHIGHRSSSYHQRHSDNSLSGISSLRKQTRSINGSKEGKRSSNPAITVFSNDNKPCNGEIDSPVDVKNDKPGLPEGDVGSSESLPQIPLSAPSSLTRSMRTTVGKYTPLNKDGRIGYKMVKGQNGHTRIFHALPEAELGEGQSERLVSTGVPLISSPVTACRKLLPLRRGMHNRRSRLKLMKHRESKNKISSFDNYYMGHNEFSGERGEGDNPENDSEEPLSDFRFLHLRKILIPQNPPNEGYTELSPSFPRRYPHIRDVVNSNTPYNKQIRLQHNGFSGGNLNDEDSIYSEDVMYSEISDGDLDID